MGTKDIEKLLTDLKNLPKQNAPEDLEERLLQRISEYERKLASGESKFKSFIRIYLNPVYVPALTIVISAALILYTLDKNKLNKQSQDLTIEKAIPVVQEETQDDKVEPQKISVPKKRDFVIKRDKTKLNLGPGINLDEPEYSYNPSETKQPAFIDFPFPEEPVTIRIPPPEIIFRKELEQVGIPFENKDSIRFINNRRR